MKIYLILLMLICQQTVLANSLEKAELLYEHGFTDKAKLVLIENIVSHNPQTSLQAYKMLGKIAFQNRNFEYRDEDDKNLHLARKTWKKLIEVYPDSKAALSLQEQYWDFINETRKIDFYGIKSGMTQTELAEVLDLKTQAQKTREKYPRYSKKSDEELIQELYFDRNTYYTGDKFAGKWFGSLNPHFDNDGKLWMLIIDHKVPDTFLEKQALKQKLTESFNQFKITEVILGRVDVYRVILIDDKMAQKSTN